VKKNLESEENYQLIFEHLMQVLTKGSKFNHSKAKEQLQEKVDERIQFLQSQKPKTHCSHHGKHHHNNSLDKYQPDEFLKIMLNNFKSVENNIRNERIKYNQEVSCENIELIEKFDDLDSLIQNCDERKLSPPRLAPRSQSHS
jgi:hypothetical protein